jgi:membrane protein
MEQVLSRSRLSQVGVILTHSIKHFVKDNGPQWAAAIAYYSLLSIFPLLLAAIAIAAYFVDPDWAIEQGTEILKDFLPSGTQFLREIVQDILQAR